jgi:ribosome maturation factor RimP
MQAGRVRTLVEAPLLRAGWVVEDVSVTPAGRRSVVRVAVDRDLAGLGEDATSPVPPVSLDDVAEATRVVDAALEAQDSATAAPYVLEVSSPGLDRPLTERRHFRRNVGRLVTLRLTDGTRAAGRIRSVTHDLVDLVADPGVDGAATPRVVALDEIVDGRVVLEFGRPDDLVGDEEVD